MATSRAVGLPVRSSLSSPFTLLKSQIKKCCSLISQANRADTHLFAGPRPAASCTHTSPDLTHTPHARRFARSSLAAQHTHVRGKVSRGIQANTTRRRHGDMDWRGWVPRPHHATATAEAGSGRLAAKCPILPPSHKKSHSRFPKSQQLLTLTKYI
jgi:hypothetical protein